MPRNDPQSSFIKVRVRPTDVPKVKETAKRKKTTVSALARAAWGLEPGKGTS